jgi:hypothetical protein
METYKQQLIALRAVAKRMQATLEGAGKSSRKSAREEDRQFWAEIAVEATDLLLDTLRQIRRMEKDVRRTVRGKGSPALANSAAKPGGNGSYRYTVTAMGADGKPLDPSALVNLSERISQQVDDSVQYGFLMSDRDWVKSLGLMHGVAPAGIGQGAADDVRAQRKRIRDFDISEGTIPSPVDVPDDSEPAYTRNLQQTPPSISGDPDLSDTEILGTERQERT